MSAGHDGLPSSDAAQASQAAPAGASSASGHLTKKIQKALTLRIDSQQSRDALKCLSGFFSENTVHNRRNLRSSIEGENLCLHKEFVHAFGALESQLVGLERLVDRLDGAVQRASDQLRASRSETQASLEKAAALRKESMSIELKQQVLDKFLTRFRLSEADTQVVRSGDRPLDDDFFAAFERLEQVRANARHMLSTSGQQTSGVDILHETSEVLEASYERMFVWVQQQCRGSRDAAVAKSTSAELETPAGNVLKRVLKLLKERPVYFNHCWRDIARVRKQALQHRFLEALTQGDASCGARPIELQAGDQVRYVSDMLAWIHENVATESEAVTALMEPEAKTGSSETHSDAVEGSTVIGIDEILDIALEGVAATLVAKTKQALQTNVAIVTMYKVAQVLSFYAKTIEDKLRRSGSALVSTCMDLHARTYQSFLDLWEAQAQKLRQGVAGVYVAALSAPSFVLEASNTLQEVLSIYELAPVPAGEREADFLPVLSAAFDPLLNHCQQVASMMDTADGHVFLINCVCAMQMPLRKHDFTNQRQEMYTLFLDDQLNRLVEGQTKAVLSKVGLAERLKALREKLPETPLNSVPELHPVSLATTLRSFYNSLFTLGGALSLRLLERIDDATLREKARKGVSALIAAEYEELYTGIEALGIATHTPNQVRTLLEGV
ncbi:COG6 [Symbiodinium natans]|uniref:Conserved oligomeric Golgi complex subunit 6 n=1 Tax=Symbiodinium natans TaxID=878477 RepID=A0A812RPP6_9DINO|nr:COG6 [Symbiodinium natans]